MKKIKVLNSLRLSLLATLLIPIVLQTHADTRGSRPNIVFILAVDMGWAAGSMVGKMA